MNTITDGLNALRIGNNAPIDHNPVVQAPALPFDLQPTAELRTNVARFFSGPLGSIVGYLARCLGTPGVVVGDETIRLIGWDFLAKNYHEPLAAEWVEHMKAECQMPIGTLTVRFLLNVDNRRQLIDQLHTNLKEHYTVGKVTHVDSESAKFSTFSFGTIHFTFASQVVPYVMSHETMQILLTEPVQLIDHGMGDQWCRDTVQKTLRVLYQGPRLEKLFLRSLRNGYVSPHPLLLPQSCFDANEVKCLQNALLLRTLEGVCEVRDATTSFWHACVSIVQNKLLSFEELEEQLQLIAMAACMFEAAGPVKVFCSNPRGMPTYFFRCTTVDAECIYQLPCNPPQKPLNPVMGQVLSTLQLTPKKRQSPLLRNIAINWTAPDLPTALLISTIVPETFAKVIRQVPMQQDPFLRSILGMACLAQDLYLNGESFLDFLLSSKHPEGFKVGLERLIQTEGNVELKLKLIPSAPIDLALRLMLQVENDPLCTQEHVRIWLRKESALVWHALAPKTVRWLKVISVSRPDQLEHGFKNSEIRKRLLDAYMEGDKAFNTHLAPYVLRISTARTNPDEWSKAIAITTVTPKLGSDLLDDYLAMDPLTALLFLRAYTGPFSDVQRDALLNCIVMPLPEELVAWYLTLPGSTTLPYKFKTSRQAAILVEIGKAYPDLISPEYVAELHARYPGDNAFVTSIRTAKLEAKFAPYLVVKKKKEPKAVVVAEPKPPTREQEVLTLLAQKDPKKRVFELIVQHSLDVHTWKLAFETFENDLMYDHIADGIVRLLDCKEVKTVWQMVFTHAQWLRSAKTLPVFDKIEEFKTLFPKMPSEFRYILKSLIGLLKEHPTYVSVAYDWFQLFPFDREIALELLTYCNKGVIEHANSMVTRLLPSLKKPPEALIRYCEIEGAAEKNVLEIARAVRSVRLQLLSDSRSLEILLTLFENRLVRKVVDDDIKPYYDAYPRLVEMATASHQETTVARACCIDFAIPVNVATKESRFALKLRCIQYKGWTENMQTLFVKAITTEARPLLSRITSARFYGFDNEHRALGSLCPIGDSTNIAFIENAIRVAIQFASEHRDNPVYFTCMMNFAVQTIRNTFEMHPKVKMSFDPIGLLIPLDRSNIIFGLLRLARRKGVPLDYKTHAEAIERTVESLDCEAPFGNMDETLKHATEETAVTTLVQVQRVLCVWQELYFLKDFEERQRILDELFSFWQRFPKVVLNIDVIQTMSGLLLPNGVQVDYFKAIESFFNCLIAINRKASSSLEPPFKPERKETKDGVEVEYTENGHIASESLARAVKDFKILFVADIYIEAPQYFNDQAERIMELFRAPSYLNIMSLIEPAKVFTETIVTHAALMPKWLAILSEHRQSDEVQMLYSPVLTCIVEHQLNENIIDLVLEMSLACIKDIRIVPVFAMILELVKADDYKEQVPLFIDRLKRLMSLLFSQRNNLWARFIHVMTAKVYDIQLQTALLADWMHRLKVCDCGNEFFNEMQDLTVRAMIKSQLLEGFILLDKTSNSVLMTFIKGWKCPKELRESYETQLKKVKSFIALEKELEDKAK